MKQNVYDDATFFEGYLHLRKNESGLNTVLEEPAIRSVLPPLAGLQVLDAGCGFGKQCMFFREEGASSITGIDISSRMIETARQQYAAHNIRYIVTALEDASFSAASFDLIVSSLAIHYLEDYAGIIKKMHSWLKPGGRLVFSVEHPIATALPQQKWIRDEQGHELYWPVDNYGVPGPRNTSWFIDNVIKYHRTLATYITVLLQQGFILRSLLEPVPAPEFIATRPELQLMVRRPAFLIIAVERQ